jgi:hypothetical protein
MGFVSGVCGYVNLVMPADVEMDNLMTVEKNLG